MTRSIRFNLTLWYIGILAVILCLFGWILYANVKSNLLQEVDEILVSQADGTADAIFSFWQALGESDRPTVPWAFPKQKKNHSFR